ncbi:threonylcarbamoyl-AMP synthase [Patescibacteria group bacterium]|nr:threonylcarbamoyl-AMP synthase [Patescibacteria group bacterium]
MQTKIIKIDKFNPEKEKISEVVEVLIKSGVIAFPTDTVYGIGVNALNKKAVKRIYEIKKRDKNKPLIILVGRKKDAHKISHFNATAQKCEVRFWPGPLTLVLPAKKDIPKYLTYNGTIGIRMPNNKIFIALAKSCEFPIATTSANLSGETSATSAQEVAEKLGLPGEASAKTDEDIDLIIDGGRTKSNVASTVLNLTSKTPKIIRQGKITLKQIK